MSDLLDVANRKIEAKRDKLKEALPHVFSQVKSAQNVNGALHSGNTASLLRDRCVEAMQSLGKVIISEYRWAAFTAVFLTQSFARELTEAAPAQMTPLEEQCNSQLAHDLGILQMGNLMGELSPSITKKREEILKDVRIELDRAFAERRRSLIRNLVLGIGNIISKIGGK